MRPRLQDLFPVPRHLEALERGFAPPRRLRVASVPGGEGADEFLRQRLEGLGFELSTAEGDGELRFRLDPSLENDQAYRLTVDSSGVEIAAAGAAGLLYGAATFCQWLVAHGAAHGSAHGSAHGAAQRPGTVAEPLELEGVRIEDAPDFAVRGVLLDISRDKVPSMATLEAWIERLAGWKINQLQLYLEHPFACAGHEVVWRDASPLTGDEVRRLDELCRQRSIDLVPNQNSFGHFHRWLRHEAYRPLAECPQGVKHPFGDDPEPFSLCPTDPGSLALLADLYDQLLPNFRSPLFNVGCDETFDLGLGRSAALCEEKGKGQVYLDFLREVHELARRRGRRIQFWGDIIVQHPELIPQLPADAVALEWGYEAGHPFAEHGRQFAASGLEFYVCPGTSSWNSLAGRASNALTNLAEAAIHGREHGAHGYLITDWGDFGHLQPQSASYLGLLAGAGFAWNVDSARAALSAQLAQPAQPAQPAQALPWGRLLDLHALDGPSSEDPVTGLGQALVDLAEVYLLPGPRPKNASTLFHLILFARENLESSRFQELTPEGLHATRQELARIHQSLAVLEAIGPEAGQVRREALWVSSMLDWAARLGLARLETGREKLLGQLPGPVRLALGQDLAALVEEYEALWQQRNRIGGLVDSRRWLARLLPLLSA